MGAAVPLLLPALSIGGSVASAGASIMQGKAQSEAAQFEQQQLQIQEQQTRTAAQQAEAKRREELTANLETIQSIRSGRGVGLGSPTGMAILSDTVTDAQQDILTERSNYLTKADLASRAATMAGRKAQTSLLAGYLGGAATIGSGFGKLYGQARV